MIQRFLNILWSCRLYKEIYIQVITGGIFSKKKKKIQSKSAHDRFPCAPLCLTFEEQQVVFNIKEY